MGLPNSVLEVGSRDLVHGPRAASCPNCLDSLHRRGSWRAGLPPPGHPHPCFPELDSKAPDGEPGRGLSRRAPNRPVLRSFLASTVPSLDVHRGGGIESGPLGRTVCRGTTLRSTLTRSQFLRWKFHPTRNASASNSPWETGRREPLRGLRSGTLPTCRTASRSSGSLPRSCCCLRGGRGGTHARDSGQNEKRPTETCAISRRAQRHPGGRPTTGEGGRDANTPFPGYFDAFRQDDARRNLTRRSDVGSTHFRAREAAPAGETATGAAMPQWSRRFSLTWAVLERPEHRRVWALRLTARIP